MCDCGIMQVILKSGDIAGGVFLCVVDFISGKMIPK